MRKLLVLVIFTFGLVVFSAPSFSFADIMDSYTQVGYGLCETDDGVLYVPVYTNDDLGDISNMVVVLSNEKYYLALNPNAVYLFSLRFKMRETFVGTCNIYNTFALVITSLQSSQTVGNLTVYNDVDDFYEDYPQYAPDEPSFSDHLWDWFYNLYFVLFGHYPEDDSIIDYIRNGIDDDDPTANDIVFPTNTPTPTPTPYPVQTIFVPDNNGGYTIIYQYPDPDTGVITQSPTNPFPDNGNGNNNNSNNYNPTDPMSVDFNGLSWASTDGDVMDSPAYTAGQSLDMIKNEVDSYEPVIKVVSNSFNILPPKWLSLIGLCGAMLLVGGLINRFLGG